MAIRSNAARSSFSTFLGGSGNEGGGDIAVDAAGSAYVLGNTDSLDFPVTAGAFRTSILGRIDHFVTKLKPDGSGLDYSTYIGGSWDGENFSRLALDGSGSTCLTGQSLSTDFPTTPDALKTTTTGWDSFLTKLKPDGSGLVYSTFLDCGGCYAFAVALDGSGGAYFTGRVAGPGFPTTSGAFQTAPGGPFPPQQCGVTGCSQFWFPDAFVMKIAGIP